MNIMLKGSCWQLEVGVNGFAKPEGNELVTQVAAGRCFELIANGLNKSISCLSKTSRIEARLLEDGYKCWLPLSEMIGQVFLRSSWKPHLIRKEKIIERLPKVLSWLEAAASQPNKYLWGGTLGPDFDCSGLIQTSFASEGIWLPRDAYQQQSFCETLEVSQGNYEILLPGDLLFFGPKEKCTHVALYKGGGWYWHSSGSKNGRNGIGCDSLNLNETNPVSCFYRAQLCGAGRVVRCHDGSSLP